MQVIVYHHGLKPLLKMFVATSLEAANDFSRSSKRHHNFKLIQNLVDAPKHKILKLCSTRWLSQGQVITRIEQWDALELFFQSEAPIDIVDGARKIYYTMTTAGT